MNQEVSTYDSHGEFVTEQTSSTTESKDSSSFSQYLVIAIGTPVVVYSTYVALFSTF